MAIPNWNQLPHTFPLSNIEAWFFYNLDVTRLPAWYLEEFEHEAILRRIAQILVRQGRFNEYTRTQIDALWEKVDSLYEYVIALEIRLDLKDAELEAMINQLREDMEEADDVLDAKIAQLRADMLAADNALQLQITTINGEQDVQDAILEQHDIRLGVLELEDESEEALLDFMRQGEDGQTIRKNDDADNSFKVEWTDAGAGVVQEIVAGTNVTVDDSDPARPIVSASGGSAGVQSVTAGSNVVITGTAQNPVINATGGGGGGGDLVFTETQTNSALDFNWDPDTQVLAVDKGNQLPAVPTADGTYVAKATVEQGGYSLGWEVGGGGVDIRYATVESPPTNGFPSVDVNLDPVTGEYKTLVVDFGNGGRVPAVDTSTVGEVTYLKSTVMDFAGNVVPILEWSDVAPGETTVIPGLGKVLNGYLVPMDNIALAGINGVIFGNTLPQTGDPSKIYTRGNDALVWIPNAAGYNDWAADGGNKNWVGGRYVRVRLTGDASQDVNYVGVPAVYWDGTTYLTAPTRRILTITQGYSTSASYPLAETGGLRKVGGDILAGPFIMGNSGSAYNPIAETPIVITGFDTDNNLAVWTKTVSGSPASAGKVGSYAVHTTENSRATAIFPGGLEGLLIGNDTVTKLSVTVPMNIRFYVK